MMLSHAETRCKLPLPSLVVWEEKKSDGLSKAKNLLHKSTGKMESCFLFSPLIATCTKILTFFYTLQSWGMVLFDLCGIKVLNYFSDRILYITIPHVVIHPSVCISTCAKTPIKV